MENEIVSIENSQNATVTCQQYNFEKYPKLSSMKIVCNDGKLVSDTGKVLTIKDLKCELKIIDIFKCDVKDCPENNLGACFAYFDNVKNSDVKLAEVCYDMNIKRTHFVRMNFSKKLQQIGTSANRKEFTDLHEKIDIIKNMIRFDYENKLRDLLDFDRSINSNDELRIHKLLPENFFNDQLKDAQKYPINNVGIWPMIFDGNWNSIVRDIKNYLITKENSIVVAFGTKGTLVSHTNKIIYSKGKAEMIPQFVWASVRNENADDGVVIVVLNDPYASANELKTKVFCKNICDTIPWLKNTVKNDNYQRPALGYTFCCSLSDFKKSMLNN